MQISFLYLTRSSIGILCPCLSITYGVYANSFRERRHRRPRESGASFRARVMNHYRLGALVRRQGNGRLVYPNLTGIRRRSCHHPKGRDPSEGPGAGLRIGFRAGYGNIRRDCASLQPFPLNDHVATGTHSRTRGEQRRSRRSNRGHQRKT